MIKEFENKFFKNEKTINVHLESPRSKEKWNMVS